MIDLATVNTELLNRCKELSARLVSDKKFLEEFQMIMRTYGPHSKEMVTFVTKNISGEGLEIGITDEVIEEEDDDSGTHRVL